MKVRMIAALTGVCAVLGFGVAFAAQSTTPATTASTTTKTAATTTTTTTKAVASTSKTAATTAAATATSNNLQPQTIRGDIVSVASTNAKLSSFLNAAQKADLTSTLQGKGPYTVFIPNNAAFARVSTASLNALMANQKKLASVLTYHLLPGKLLPAQLTGQTLKTVDGVNVSFKTSHGNLMINNATVLAGPVVTNNGVIYVINSVLMPK